MKVFCTASIGTILGIIMGLYLKSIALFVICIFSILIILINIIYKIYHKKVNIAFCIIFLISILIFYSYTNILEKKYKAIYSNYDNQEIRIEAIVISNPKEDEYKKTYTIKILKVQNLSNGKEEKLATNFLCYVKKGVEIESTLKYGNKIEVYGTYDAPSVARNEGGFNYSMYLKGQKISGIINAKSIKILSKNEINFIEKSIHNLKNNLIENIRKILPEETSALCIGLLLGDKSYISEDVQNSFRASSLSHMLAISGAHVSYILLAITSLIKFTKIHKRWGNILVILFLIFFMILVGFTPSVTRACIMCILTLIANILFLKPNVYNNLAISSIIILIINPYCILDIGFQLSFGGTVGIILLMNKKITKENNKKETIKSKISQIAKVSISANLIIIPIMVYHFNTISLTFIISNLLASPILAICLIGSMIFIVLLIIFSPMALVFSYLLNPVLKSLLIIANFTSKLPFSQILIPTPNILQIFLYYLVLILYKFKSQINTLMQNFSNILNEYELKNKILKKRLIVVRKVKNKVLNSHKILPIVSFIKCKKIILILAIFLILLPYFIKFPMSKLTIKFIDVGQGDSTLIETPSRKTILIDGGGSEVGSFDVGEKTLLPFLLDNNIMKIDYMLFSHLDTDHCGRITYLTRKN